MLQIRKAFWLFPFLAFGVGYFFLQFLITDHAVLTPTLLGKNILQATQICSELKLNLRIIAEKEVADVPAGTIIKQKPMVDKYIKQHQSIFIVMTKMPETMQSPDFVTKNSNFIEKSCQDLGIKNKTYLIESAYPKGQCFGQIPLPEQPLPSKKMSCYISAGNNQKYIFPHLIDQPLADVIDFLQKYEITCDVYYKDQKIAAPFHHQFMVVNQKPLAGTFVQPNNQLYVQLQVALP